MSTSATLDTEQATDLYHVTVTSLREDGTTATMVIGLHDLMYNIFKNQDEEEPLIVTLDDILTIGKSINIDLTRVLMIEHTVNDKHPDAEKALEGLQEGEPWLIAGQLNSQGAVLNAPVYGEVNFTTSTITIGASENKFLCHRHAMMNVDRCLTMVGRPSSAEEHQQIIDAAQGKAADA